MGVDGCMKVLRDADSVVDIGHALRELRRSHAMLQTAFDLWARDTVPIAVVDDIPTWVLSDDARVEYLRWIYRIDPMRQVVLRTRGALWPGPASPEYWRIAHAEGRWKGGSGLTSYIPLIDEAGIIGSIRLVFVEPTSNALHRDLARLAQHVSVRLAKLGVGAAEDPARLACLTARQQQVAMLAARGDTNREIAEELGVSHDAVKKHLKLVFDRLGIDDRRELAALIARAAPVTEGATGVTTFGGIHLTRLDLHVRAAEAACSPGDPDA